MAGKKVAISLNIGSNKVVSISFSRFGLLSWSAALITCLFFFGAVTYQVIRTGMLLSIFSGDSPEAIYQRKVDYLAGEVVKVKQYEKELKGKAEQINTVLQGLSGMELMAPKADLPKTGNEKTYRGGGMGGVEPDENSTVGLREMVRRMDNKPKEKPVLSFIDQNINVLQGLPLGTPMQGGLSSGFGIRRSPFSRVMQMHTGLDLINDWNYPVQVTAPGEVIFSGWDGAYGLSVIIDHGNNVMTRYAHLTRTQVKEGEKVNRGQIIGNLGSTGRSTGPHLHYEVMVNGNYKDPIRFIELATALKRIK
ncbi:MAG: M23 family metallopeptidase [Deltaproteobacteria bacterium]|nr:M23 family metallopeptidase [Deltaproteobacteria bacterium]